MQNVVPNILDFFLLEVTQREMLAERPDFNVVIPVI